MKFQEFCVRQIQHALSQGLTREQLENPVYTYALKGGLVRLYAETYYLKARDCEFKFWDLDFGSNRTVRGFRVWENLLCSRGAYALCEKMENRLGREQVHYEHIEPAGVTYCKLLNLNGNNLGEARIKAILDRSKLVVLTEEEREFLDRIPNTVFTQEDRALVEQWYADGFISRAILKETLESMVGSTRDNGTAYARLAHLMKKGVEFVWGKKPDLSGGELIAAYLKDKDHSI
ncbi:MAG: hypothetical protein IKQ15_02580 [Kiritimatiellae bacterium]|nr:hypothetical protein [Kiritimatiellia bacterium]